MTFASVGRRLALMNAVVVVLVIAVVGILTLFLLRAGLDRQADRALRERAQAARAAWADQITSGQPVSVSLVARQRVGNEQEEDEDEDEGHDEWEDDEEMEELLESGDTFLFAVDRAGAVLANPRGLLVSGLPAQDSVAAALTGRPDTRTVETGGRRIRVHSEPVFAGGEVVGVVQAARELSEQERERRYVAIASLVGIGLGTLIAVPTGLFLASRAMRPISEAFARQRAFVADASHELRTPLTLIRANAELLERLPEPSPDDVRAEAAAILAEIDELGRLVDDLLLLARLDEGAPVLQRSRIDLASVVREAATAMRVEAERKGLSLAIEAVGPAIADADAERIGQITRILLDNAIAYTPAGGSVRVSVSVHGARAVVAVRDTGIGIAPEDQARVFDRFYRADPARSRRTGGTGLGLAIARALVLAHGGEIHLESEAGKGTTVWFALPLKRGPAT